MKKQLFSLLLLLSLAFGIAAQNASDSAQNLRKHVEYLASDQFEGRRTGEQGATGAAGYVANMFAQVKLKAGYRLPNGKVAFMQPFPFITGVEPAATGNSTLLELSGADGKRARMDNLPGIKAVGFSPNGELSGLSVVFAGYGITSPEAKYDDYADLDVRGKIILVFDGTPENDNPHSQFGRFDARTKALIARDKGAAGVLLISREAKLDDDPLSKLKYDQTLGEAALPTFVVSRETAANILGLKEAEIKSIEDITKMKSGASYDVRLRFRDTAPLLSFRVNLEKKQADAYNVIGVLEGRDPVLKNEAIVIGAHYDHLGRGGTGSLAVNSTEIHHGADDNASGTAAIIELARIFAKEKNNKRTIVFVAFSGEEGGLIGSKYYVNNPVVPLEKTVAMINLDMVGRMKNNKMTVGGIGTASEWKILIDNKNINPGAIVPGGTPGGGPAPKLNKFDITLNEDGFGPSDHSSFYGKKIPVLFFFTGSHEDYHKPSDTADKVNYADLDGITWFVADVARTIDQNPVRPTYTVAKSSGAMGGGRGFTVSLGTVPSYSESTDGMLLDGVRDNSPAAKAGLKAGDKIVKLAGKEVRNVMDYTYILGTMKAGEEYEVEIVRGAEKLTLKIVPAAAARR
jgi:hypothetical protein